MTATAIPASLATACAAHDRHRLDVLDALLDEADPSAVRELLGAALDMCATLRADRDGLAAQIAEMRDLARDAADDRAARLEADLASERAHLAACQTRIAGLEQAANERSAEVARLTARVAELEARPVLTEERLIEAWCGAGAEIGTPNRSYVADLAGRAMRHLGPVTLPPARDRAEEIVAKMQRYGWWCSQDSGDGRCEADMRRALASLGAPPTSPPVAVEMRLCEATRVVLRPGTLYRFTVDDGCEACRDAATMSPPAARPVFAGVSLDELACAWFNAGAEDSDKNPYVPHNICDFDRKRTAAVLARLEVSLVVPVDPEAVARVIINEIICSGTVSVAAAESHIRRTLTSAGVPVTPEVGK